MAQADDLLLLLEVARSGTYSAAAGRLGLAHTTVSRRIRAMEREFRQRLVVSTAAGCQLTEFGRSLLEPAERIDRALSMIDTTVGREPSPAAYTGLVRIRAPEAFGAQFVAPVLAGMVGDHPEVRLELVTATRPVVQGDGVDIEIGVGEPISRRVHTVPLTDYTLGLYASPAYLERHGHPARPADMQAHSLVYYVDSLLRVSDLDFIDTLMPGTSIRVGSTSVHAQLAVTRAGAGIGILPDFLAMAQTGLIPVLPEQVSVTLQFTAAVPPEMLRRPAAQEVLNRLRREVVRRRAELLPHRRRRGSASFPSA